MNKPVVTLAMTSPATATSVLCYLNGEFLPFSEARLPVYDLGIMQGATVTERLRTFRHVPGGVTEHLARLQQSLLLTRWKSLPSLEELSSVISILTIHNCQFLSSGEDLAIVIFITAGQSLGDANQLIERSKPTVCVYTAPLPFSQWVHGYLQGVDLVVPEIRQIPRSCIDPHIKMRSRLHWHMADQAVREANPRAQALLLDERDHLTETSSGNLLLVQQGVLRTPRAEMTLNGISRQLIERMCEDRHIDFEFTDLTVDDMFAADEAFLTSSTYCLMPVRSLNGQRIGTALPGPVTQQLTQIWSDKIGLSFVEQSLRHGLPVA